MSSLLATEHPDRETLLLYLDDLLDAERDRQVEDHTDACLPCRELLRQLVDGASGPAIMPTVMEMFAPRDAASSPIPTIPGYRLRRLLGEGGMGTVYLGRDEGLQRPVAVKVMKAPYSNNPELVRRFVEEARVTSQLQHPGIPPLHELGTLADGSPYFAMKVIKGHTLATLLAKRPGPPGDLSQFLPLFLQVCQAVAYAHSRGVIHRDLKPGNVMVGAFGEVLVLDWGLAKVLRQGEPETITEKSTDTSSVVATGREAELSEWTRDGSALGTWPYMPPEQARGLLRLVTCRSDVFGLGAILCELLTGQPPYAGNRDQVREQAMMADLSPAWQRLQGSGADEELVALAQACLEEKTEGRPADAGEVARQVAAYQVLVEERLRDVERERAAAEARAEEAKRTAEARFREEEARRVAESERRTRRLTLALAGVLLVGLLTAGYLLMRAVASEAIAARNADEATQARDMAEMERQRADGARREAVDLAGEREKGIQEADRQRRLAEDARREAEKERLRSEGLTYQHQLALAQREWEANNAGAAFEHLEATRKDFQGWEYWHLKTLFNSNQKTFRGHRSAVKSVAFSPDGKRITSASGDNTVKVWDAESGKDVRILKGHTDPVTCVAFSLDGKRIASASQDKTVNIWDAQSGQEVLTLKGHTREIWCVAFSPDGKRIASAGQDKTLKVWDAESGQEVHTLKGHTDGVLSVAFSLDGKRIVSGSGDRTVKVWDAEIEQEVQILKGHTDPVTCVVFSPDGKRIASASQDKTVNIWDAESEHEVLTLKGHTREVWCVVFSPDGKRIASASEDNTVKVWDAERGQEVLTLKGHTAPVTSVVFSPDGKRIVSGSGDRTVKVWDVEREQEVLTLKGHNKGVTSVVFSPDGKQIASASWDGTGKVWDADTTP